MSYTRHQHDELGKMCRACVRRYAELTHGSKCLVCGQRLGEHAHHVVPRSLESNPRLKYNPRLCIWVCRHCHAGLESGDMREELEEMMWRHLQWVDWQKYLRLYYWKNAKRRVRPHEPIYERLRLFLAMEMARLEVRWADQYNRDEIPPEECDL